MRIVEYHLLDVNMYCNQYIDTTISKTLFNKWLQYYNKSTYSRTVKIYKKTTQYRNSIIQENIQPKSYKPNTEITFNSEQNYLNYIQKYNEYNEDILIPKMTYIYEYISTPSFIYKQNRYPFLSITNTLEYIENTDLQSHINDPTDIFEINEITFDCNSTNEGNNLYICFCIKKDIYRNKDNIHYSIKFIENIENSLFYRYNIPNIL